MIFNPAWALNASTSALVWRIISSIGRSNWKFTGLTLNLALASASGLLSCSFMRLLVLVCFSFHRRACLLGTLMDCGLCCSKAALAACSNCPCHGFLESQPPVGAFPALNVQMFQHD